MRFSFGATSGAVVAGIISWVHFHSIAWTIWDALWGWLYVIYYVIKYGFH